MTDSPSPAPAPAWARLRAVADAADPGLRAPLPAGPGCCAVCRGPALAGYRYCYQCAQHRQDAPGLLADLVVPVSYSIAGTPYARWLRTYKDEAAGLDAAGAALRSMLLVFLHDHGCCLWAAAGTTAPSHVAVVPTGCSRPGVHPLRGLVGPYLALPWAGLAPHPGLPVYARDLDVHRFLVAGPLAGATVLLLDDTWATGSSVQSAAAALKLAGARSVIAVILGRHVNPSHPLANSFVSAAGGNHFQPGRCAVHGAARAK